MRDLFPLPQRRMLVRQERDRLRTKSESYPDLKADRWYKCWIKEGRGYFPGEGRFFVTAICFYRKTGEPESGGCGVVHWAGQQTADRRLAHLLLQEVFSDSPCHTPQTGRQKRPNDSCDAWRVGKTNIVGVKYFCHVKIANLIIKLLLNDHFWVFYCHF